MKIDGIIFYLRDISNNTLKLENNPVKAYARLLAVIEEIEQDEAYEMEQMGKDMDKKPSKEIEKAYKIWRESIGGSIKLK